MAQFWQQSFVAKIEEKAQKIDKDEFYSAVELKRVTGLFKFDGMYFVPQWPMDVAIRFCKKGGLQSIGCASIVRTVKSKDVIMRWSGRHYRLSKEVSTQIEDYGDLLC